jgi:predicted O-methyltransferase YrrM
MYSPFRLAGKYLRYYLSASNGKGHSIHSPFVFEFVTKILHDQRGNREYAPIEALRERLRRDPTLLVVEDMGAGSASPASSTRRIRDIVRYSAKPPRLGQLLFRVARHYQPSTILELGTSLGLSTAYLAAGSPGSNLYTIEGACPLAAVADAHLHSLQLDAKIITGNFDNELIPLLDRLPPIDLAFIDGNHRYDPTLRYFEAILRHCSRSAVLIFDDIHWSAEMEKAWAAIKNDPRIYLTIDLFFLGFVFIREEFKVKQDFTIRF